MKDLSKNKKIEIMCEGIVFVSRKAMQRKRKNANGLY